jgi:hypothetical protein
MPWNARLFAGHGAERISKQHRHPTERAFCVADHRLALRLERALRDVELLGDQLIATPA